MLLRVAQLIADTEAEGPGKRFAIWVQGCSLRCPGCCNPEMFAADRGGTLISPAELAERVRATADLEGISVLGGEPFEQAEGVAELCRLVRAQGRSVMVYTGYTLAELRAKQSPHVDALLGQIDLLVDGRYEQALPERGGRRWIGSSNQVLHFFTTRYSPADPRFSTSNTVELRFVDGQLTINGWPQAADALRKR
ncbi:MAG: 4Fe-4S single cluster domain-containing protein [Myxococcota bacterium]